MEGEKVYSGRDGFVQGNREWKRPGGRPIPGLPRHQVWRGGR